MSRLAEFLSSMPSVGRPVQDMTQLSGRFDFTLAVLDTKPDSPEQMKSALLKWDSILSDVQEKLGLRFDSEKGMVEAIIIIASYPILFGRAYEHHFPKEHELYFSNKKGIPYRCGWFICHDRPRLWAGYRTRTNRGHRSGRFSQRHRYSWRFWRKRWSSHGQALSCIR